MRNTNATIKAVIVTNVPAPYRVPVWRRVAEAEGIELELIFCAPAHIDTATRPDDYGFSMHFLSGRYFAMQRRFMHYDLNVWSLLNRLKPDVVITTGYIPTFLFAFAWAYRHGVPHIAMNDGTVESERRLTTLHRWIRKLVYRHSDAFVGACAASRALFKQYGIPPERIHLSYLCADNDKFTCPPADNPADFIFCGRFISHKRPLFAIQVAYHTAMRLGRKTVIDFVGSGIMEAELHDFAAKYSQYVDCRFQGYATQQELPHRYAAARIFLFPSEWDPWGVVANEACAAGLPVIVSPYPGVVNELLIDGFNAYVRDLDIELWVNAAVDLLSDETLYRRFSDNARSRVATYSYDNSALGLINAINQAAENHGDHYSIAH
ncbi:MAG: glycosyltransferase family 4 protein [Methylomonas sp.]|jgi:glycosyltransferase involved in cell wall biosynthesis